MNSLSLMLKPRSLQRSCLPQSRPILSSRESAKPFQRMREEREGREIRWGKHALSVSQSLSRPRGSYGIRSSVRRPLSPSGHPSALRANGAHDNRQSRHGFRQGCPSLPPASFHNTQCLHAGEREGEREPLKALYPCFTFSGIFPTNCGSSGPTEDFCSK